jgi:hypothetical protein
MFCFIVSVRTTILRQGRLVYSSKWAEQCVSSLDSSPCIMRSFEDKEELRMKRTVNNNRDVSSLRSEVEELINQAFKRSRKASLVTSSKHKNAESYLKEYYILAIIAIVLGFLPGNIAVKTVLFAFVSLVFCEGRRFIFWKDRKAFGLLEGFVQNLESSEKLEVSEDFGEERA